MAATANKKRGNYITSQSRQKDNPDHVRSTLKGVTETTEAEQIYIRMQEAEDKRTALREAAKKSKRPSPPRKFSWEE